MPKSQKSIDRALARAKTQANKAGGHVKIRYKPLQVDEVCIKLKVEEEFQVAFTRARMAAHRNLFVPTELGFKLAERLDNI